MFKLFVYKLIFVLQNYFPNNFYVINFKQKVTFSYIDFTE